MSLKSELEKLQTEYDNNRARMIVNATTKTSFVCGENSLKSTQRYSLSIYDIVELYDLWFAESPNFYPQLAKDKLIVLLEKYTDYNEDINSIVSFAESLHNDWMQ